MVDLIQSKFDYMRYCIQGHGYNTGADVSLNKESGKLRGYISYSLCFARRKFDFFGDRWIAASQERRHTINVVSTYRLSERWMLGATFMIADGTPYTGAKYVYNLNGSVFPKMTDFNDCKLPLYHRLDFNVDFKAFQFGRTHIDLNFSVYNVYAKKNPSLILYRFNTLEEQQVSLLPWPIPSLNVNITF